MKKPCFYAGTTLVLVSVIGTSIAPGFWFGLTLMVGLAALCVAAVTWLEDRYRASTSAVARAFAIIGAVGLVSITLWLFMVVGAIGMVITNRVL